MMLTAWFLILMASNATIVVPAPYPTEQACLTAARSTHVHLPPWDVKMRGDRPPYTLAEAWRFACLPVPK